MSELVWMQFTKWKKPEDKWQGICQALLECISHALIQEENSNQSQISGHSNLLLWMVKSLSESFGAVPTIRATQKSDVVRCEKEACQSVPPAQEDCLLHCWRSADCVGLNEVTQDLRNCLFLCERDVEEQQEGLALEHLHCIAPQELLKAWKGMENDKLVHACFLCHKQIISVEEAKAIQQVGSDRAPAAAGIAALSLPRWGGGA